MNESHHFSADPINVTSNQQPGFLLAISSSQGVANVCAVRQNLQWIFEFEIVDYREQSARLLPMLSEAMQTAGLTGADCLAIVADIGPGGFTSLRTTCGVAQGLATAWNVPCIPLTSFEGMVATHALQMLNPKEVLNAAQQLQIADTSLWSAACFMDAKLQELYAARLVIHPQHTEWQHDPCLLPFNEQAALEWIQPNECVLLESGLSARLNLSTDTHTGIPANISRNTFTVQRVGPALAKGVAALGVLRYQSGVREHLMACQPLYVRDKVAQTTQERQAQKK